MKRPVLLADGCPVTLNVNSFDVLLLQYLAFGWAVEDIANKRQLTRRTIINKIYKIREANEYKTLVHIVADAMRQKLIK